MKQNNETNEIEAFRYDLAVRALSHMIDDMKISAFDLSSILSVCYDTTKEAVLNDIVALRRDARK